MSLRYCLSAVLFVAVPLGFSGCGSREAPAPAVPAAPAGDGHEGHDHKPGEGHDHGKEQASAGDHSGWWCAEHGIPEAECSMCSPKVAAECQQKGDWCKEHDRAKSQCFVCDPMLKDKYAALYKAKTGNDPPATEDETKPKS